MFGLLSLIPYAGYVVAVLFLSRLLPAVPALIASLGVWAVLAAMIISQWNRAG